MSFFHGLGVMFAFLTHILLFGFIMHDVGAVLAVYCIMMIGSIPWVVYMAKCDIKEKHEEVRS